MQLMKAHMRIVVIATVLLFVIVISQALPGRIYTENLLAVLVSLAGYVGTVALVFAHALLREPARKAPNRYPDPEKIPEPEQLQ